MPGLRLTMPQARRLWQVDASDCEAALAALVEEGFLAVTLDDAYVALPTTARIRLKPLKASIEPSVLRRGA